MLYEVITMFAQPGQTIAALEQDLFRLLDEAPAHLSCYGLTVEDGTPYHERQLVITSYSIHYTKLYDGCPTPIPWPRRVPA